MRTKNQILKRINLLYYIFFAVIVVSIIVGVSGRDAQAGFKQGYQRAQVADSLLERGYHFEQFPFIQNDIRTDTYNIPILTTPDSSLVVNGRINLVDIQVMVKDESKLNSPQKTIGQVLLLLGIIAYIAVFVVVLIILSSLRRSAREGDIFARRNIFRTRLIAILLIMASLISDVAIYLRDSFALKLLEGSDFCGYVAFPISFGNLLVGMLILFIAEVFAVGYDLTEEEKLTI